MAGAKKLRINRKINVNLVFLQKKAGLGWLRRVFLRKKGGLGCIRKINMNCVFREKRLHWDGWGVYFSRKSWTGMGGWTGIAWPRIS